MPSTNHRAALLDMQRHIDLAYELTAGFDAARFMADVRTTYAVVRCLEIISEASCRPPAERRARHEAIARRNIAAAGNIYRHEYEDVSPKLVRDTVQLALPPLRAVVMAELSRLNG